MKSRIDVFNIETQEHIGYVKPEQVEKFVIDYRNKGYSVFVDRDQDICIDESDDDSGLTYKEMINQLKE